MPKVQNASRIAKLLLQYPSIVPIHHRWTLFNTSHKSHLDIRVQKADTDLMFLQARNAWHDGRMYFSRPSDSLRGCRTQHLFAVDENHRILAHIFPTTFEMEQLFFKDIFTRVLHPFEVKYLLWVTNWNWHACPSEAQSQEEDILFGELVESELEVVVYTKPKELSWDQLVEQATKIKFERENAYKHPPKETPAYPALHQVLKSGATIHGFRSGGGLRVVYTRKTGDKKEFYGEAPNIEEALRYLEEDIIADGQDYSDVYGKLHPHYLTGSSQATSNLDCWLLNGHTLDFVQDGENVSVTLLGYTHTDIPPKIAEKSEQNPGKRYRWQNRGFRYITVYHTHLFANGEGGHQTSCTNQKNVPKKDPWMYPSTQTGIGKNIWEAFQNALKADSIEVIKTD